MEEEKKMEQILSNRKSEEIDLETDIESGSEHGHPPVDSGVSVTMWRYFRTGLSSIVSKMTEDEESTECGDTPDDNEDFIESIKEAYSQKYMEEMLKVLDCACTSEGLLAWETFLYFNRFLPVYVWPHSEDEDEDNPEQGICKHPFISYVQSTLEFDISKLDPGNVDLTQSLEKGMELPGNLLEANVWITEIQILLISRETEHPFEVHSSIEGTDPVICRRHRFESDQIELTGQSLLKPDTKSDWFVYRNSLCGLYLAGITQKKLKEYMHMSFQEDKSKKVLIFRTFRTNLLLQTLKESVIDHESMSDITLAFACHGGEYFKLYETTWEKILEFVPQQFAVTKFSESHLRIRRFDGQEWSTQNNPEKGLVSIKIGIHFVHTYESALDTGFAFLKK